MRLVNLLPPEVISLEAREDESDVVGTVSQNWAACDQLQTVAPDGRPGAPRAQIEHTGRPDFDLPLEFQAAGQAQPGDAQSNHHDRGRHDAWPDGGPAAAGGAGEGDQC